MIATSLWSFKMTDINLVIKIALLWKYDNILKLSLKSD